MARPGTKSPAAWSSMATLVIRDPNVWFAVLPGRDGQRYAKYRFPQSVAGVIAILAADYSGPVNEGRRHFYFTMIGAVASAALAVIYAAFFRHLGSWTTSFAALGRRGYFLHAELVLWNQHLR